MGVVNNRVLGPGVGAVEVFELLMWSLWEVTIVSTHSTVKDWEQCCKALILLLFEWILKLKGIYDRVILAFALSP